MTTLKSLISNSAALVIADPKFKHWFANETPSKGDVILLNTSFLQRKGAGIGTTKSGLCLAYRVNAGGNLAAGPLVASNAPKFNNEFKCLAAASKNLPALAPVGEATRHAMRSLGEVVYVLIGDIIDDLDTTAAVNLTNVSQVIWRPGAVKELEIDGQDIIIKAPYNETRLWTLLQAEFATAKQAIPNKLQEHFVRALDQLQDEGVARVNVPPSRKPSKPGGILEDIAHQLDGEVAAYEAALLLGTIPNTEVLRLAYNFASDVLGLLRLIITICDLKPVLQWATVGEHLTLWRSLQALPWARAIHKPSLEDYQAAIANARNAAFHNAMPFQKMLRVNLPDGAMRNITLEFFGQFGQKDHNKLNYDDKEVFQALLNFRRARHRTIDQPQFWRLNAVVMKAIVAVIRATALALKAARRQSN